MRSIKQMLDEQEVVVGLMIQHVCAPWIAKVYADAGSDFVFVEGEHIFLNGPDVANLVLGARLCGLPVVAKTPYLDRGAICKLMDTGVTGMQLPMTESAAQMAELVRYTKFPPVGVRAAAPGLGNTDYEAVHAQQWLEEANRETVVIAHIESRTGLDNVDAILAVPGVDIMFIGTFDLSVSLGFPECYDHPEIAKAIQRLIEAAQAHGKSAGMYVPSYELAEPWLKRGMRFFETAGDIRLIARGAADLMRSFPGHGPRVSSKGKGMKA